MHWFKKGFIFAPEHDSWMHSYAQVPTALLLDDRIRVYIGCRPRNSDPYPISQIGYLELDRDDPSIVLYESTGPVLSLGRTGCFDEFGLHPLSVIRNGSEIWLYYVGWTRMVSVPFNRAIGLAISSDNGLSFQRVGSGPILGPTVSEPYLQQGPSVKICDGVWHMWYLGGIDWIEDCGRMEAIYQIMHATSSDGIAWKRDGIAVMETVTDNECHAGQAIIQIDGLYHMWFSYRRGLDFRNPVGGYRIGYATSTDLINWVRDDSRVGIEVSESGWDSEMICYPNILEFDGKVYMFYCGNHFGRDGFGFAELVSSK